MLGFQVVAASFDCFQTGDFFCAWETGGQASEGLSRFEPPLADLFRHC